MVIESSDHSVCLIGTVLDDGDELHSDIMAEEISEEVARLIVKPFI